MLTQLTVRNFRGIRDGQFTELGPINIVVGPNNCGKSTFLEALYLLLGPQVGNDPLGRNPYATVALRRNELEGGALPRIPPTWWHRLDQNKPITIMATVQVPSAEPGRTLEQTATAKFASGNSSTSVENGGFAERRIRHSLLLDLDMVRDSGVEKTVWVQLFKKRQDKPLAKALSEIYDLPVENMSMSTSGELLVGLPEVGLPIDSLGSGARVSLRLLMGALVTEGSLLMLEEIDAFQSSVSLSRLARTLLDTCAKGDVQLFLTTHRHQTISAFLEAGRDAAVDVRVLPFVAGKDGLVRARGISGADASALADSGADLRDLYRSMRAE